MTRMSDAPRWARVIVNCLIYMRVCVCCVAEMALWLFEKSLGLVKHTHTHTGAFDGVDGPSDASA